MYLQFQSAGVSISCIIQPRFQPAIWYNLKMKSKFLTCIFSGILSAFTASFIAICLELLSVRPTYEILLLRACHFKNFQNSNMIFDMYTVKHIVSLLHKFHNIRRIIVININEINIHYSASCCRACPRWGLVFFFAMFLWSFVWLGKLAANICHNLASEIK